MDGFIRKVNQKINLPDDACPDFAFLKHGFLKTRPIKSFQICYIVLYTNVVLWSSTWCFEASKEIFYLKMLQKASYHMQFRAEIVINFLQ